MAEEAIADAGLETTDQSVVDQTAEQIEASVDGAETTETTEEAPAGLGTQPYKAVSEDGKRLDEKARATIDEIRAKDPALAKAFRDAIFDADRLRRALPGGIKEVQQLRQTIEQLGGETGIAEVQEKLAGWDSFDNQYMAGDPKALEFMLSSPESQQAFMKLAPMAFNKFEELNPEGYASYLCQRIMGDAIANRIPISMELAQHYLQAGDAAKAAEEFGKVNAWLQGLDATAKKPIAPPQQKAPAGDDPRFKELEQENASMLRDSWQRESAQLHNSVYSTELNRLLAGRKITDAQREDILLRVKTKLDIRAKEDSPKIDSYFKVKDKDGYLKLAKSFGEKHIPQLLREAVDRYVPQKPGPKNTANTANGAPVRPPVNGKPADGFAFVQQAPSRDQIDWSNPFNTIQNMKQGKAITVDGKKVSWRK